jgi:ketosteroid isomerase-like protein
MDISTGVRGLYARLAEGDIGVLGLFCRNATVDTPIMGRQEPPEFVVETRAWLERHDARVRDVRTTETPTRIAHEIVLDVRQGDETVQLPVMVVADVEGDCIRDLRVYHSTWPLTGSHAVRSPLMAYDATERPAEPVGSYHDALARGDAAAADAAFEPEGSVREPAGTAHEHTGPERTEWYESILGDGPLPLRLGTIADDGTTVVFEYLVDRWGSHELAPQAGAAAYTRGPNGKIASARIYDDVEPPAFG